MKKIAMLLAFSCFSFACAEEEPTVYESGDFKYILLDDGTAEITGYIGTAEELTIPAELDGYAVSSIGDDAFYFRDSLTQIMIPDSVVSVGVNSFAECYHLTNIQVSPDHPVLETVDGVLFDKTEKKLIRYPCAFEAEVYEIPQGIRIIGDYAFSSCRSLTQITIPDSVTAIGDYAFSWCTSLTQITIPDSVVLVGANPFAGCDQLTKIQVSPDHPVLAMVDGVLFDKAEKKLICYPCAIEVKAYEIPQDIRIIGDSAFFSCESLKQITIPDSVTAIDDWAFYSCRSLTQISIPESVTAIGDEAFHFCTSLKQITIPDSVTEIGDYAFSGCPDSLTLTVGRDSYAEEYAKANDISYTYPDAND